MTMQLELDERLVEGIVFQVLSSGREPDLYRNYRAALDLAYESGAGAGQRERLFREIHSQFFVRLGHDESIRALLDELPLLARELDLLAFRLARTRKAEGADLLVSADATDRAPKRTAFVAIRPERFLDPDAIATWLRRELLHISDILDPAFAYRPDALGDHSIARANLIRDRYQVLWSWYIDARLVCSRRLPPSNLRRGTTRLRIALPEHWRRAAKRILRSAHDHEALRHDDLMELATG